MPSTPDKHSIDLDYRRSAETSKPQFVLALIHAY